MKIKPGVKYEFSENELLIIAKLSDQGIGATLIARQLGLTKRVIFRAFKLLNINVSNRRAKVKSAHLYTEKKCGSCQKIKTIDCFLKLKNGGYFSYCFECVKEFRTRKILSKKQINNLFKIFTFEQLGQIKILFIMGNSIDKISNELKIKKSSIISAVKFLKLSRKTDNTLNNEIITDKKCNKCKITKDIISFRKINNKSSYFYLCSDCEKINSKLKFRARQEKLGKLPMVKLTQEQINNIIILYESGLGCGKISKKLDITKDKIKRILRKAGFNLSIRASKKISSEQKLANRRQRWKNDIIYRTHKQISCLIRRYLKINNSSKNGQSISDLLPFTFEEYKLHMESKFDGENAWMNWDNQGIYNAKTHNISPTWQLDHIIPQSDLPFTKEDMYILGSNFFKCWSLENLRPLDSKQNLIDGVRRTRHKIV